MKIYLAGVGTNPETLEYELMNNPIYRLYSYFDLKQGGRLKRIFEKMEKKLKHGKIFLDSGAFSAWTQKKELNVYEYIDFIKEHKDVISVYANLDVIGDPDKTWKHQRIMEKKGLNPLPVFHFSDLILHGDKYLHKCMEYDYFCLGGMARGYTQKQRNNFFNHCFSIICDTPDNKPSRKIHGFGLTNFLLLFKYPWFSVDSTSWAMTAALGSIMVPKKRNGKRVYDLMPFKICVSDKNFNSKKTKEHFLNLSPLLQKNIKEYVEEMGFKIGAAQFKTENNTYKLKEGERWNSFKDKDEAKRKVIIIEEEGISNNTIQRALINAYYFIALEKELNSRERIYIPNKGKL